MRLLALLILLNFACTPPKKVIYPYYSNEDLNDLKLARMQNPNNVELTRRLAVAYRENGFLNEAEICFNKALELAPKYSSTYVGRAKNRLKMGDLSGAKQDCETANKLLPYSILGQLEYTEGLILLNEKNYKKALKKFKQADWKDDIVNEPLFLYHFAYSYQHINAPKKALTKINAFLYQFPNSCKGLFLRKKIYETLNKNKDAEKDSISIIHLCQNFNFKDTTLFPDASMR